MKAIFISFSFFIFSLTAYGQKGETLFIFNEFSISLNRTNLSNDNTKDRFGFGIGIFRSILEHKKTNLVFGFEYNLTNQLKEITYEGRFARATNVEYEIHNVTFPINIRYNIGNKVKYFLQTGVFIDLIVSSKRKGIMHSYLPDNNNNIVFKEYLFNEKAGLTNQNYGFEIGLGLRIPIKKLELIIKSDYKLGLNNLSTNKNIYNRYFRLVIGIRI